jgi:hypothetical protein
MTRTNYRVTLPATGYIVISTTIRDGRPANDGLSGPTLVFLPAHGARAVTDDADAVAWFDNETDLLARYAPQDVLHIRRLVYRSAPDGAGDRPLADAETRGVGAPLQGRA